MKRLGHFGKLWKTLKILVKLILLHVYHIKGKKTEGSPFNAVANDYKLLTNRVRGSEGPTGEYWSEVVAVRTEHRKGRTKMTEGEYSPV